MFIPALTIMIAALIGGSVALNSRDPRPLNQTAKDATVHVVGDVSRGSGVYLGNKIVLTAGHVCENMRPNTTIVVSTNSKQETEAKRFFIDKRAPMVDLCVIELKTIPVDLVALDIAKEEAQLDAEIYLSSYSGGMAYSFRRGHVLAEESFNEGPLFFLVTLSDIFVDPGASGGPVINANKELVGIMIIKLNSGIGGYVPLSQIKQFLTGQLNQHID